MSKHCDRCFKQAETVPYFDAKGPQVCKSCKYQLGQLLDFAHYHGFRLASSNPPTPQDSDAPESPGRRKKGKDPTG